MTKFQQFTFVCAPAPFQMAAALADGVDMSAEVAAYRKKRDFLCDGLAEAGYAAKRPGGAFYLFIPVPWGTDEEFARTCISRELLVIPGGVFSERKTHFRIAYAVKDEMLARGLEILKRLRTKP